MSGRVAVVDISSTPSPGDDDRVPYAAATSGLLFVAGAPLG